MLVITCVLHVLALLEFAMHSFQTEHLVNLCVCVCTYACMHVCVCTYVCMCVCVYVYARLDVRMCMHIWMYVCVYV